MFIQSFLPFISIHGYLIVFVCVCLYTVGLSEDIASPKKPWLTISHHLVALEVHPPKGWRQTARPMQSWALWPGIHRCFGHGWRRKTSTGFHWTPWEDYRVYGGMCFALHVNRTLMHLSGHNSCRPWAFQAFDQAFCEPVDDHLEQLLSLHPPTLPSPSACALRCDMWHHIAAKVRFVCEGSRCCKVFWPCGCARLYI